MLERSDEVVKLRGKMFLAQAMECWNWSEIKHRRILTL